MEIFVSAVTGPLMRSTDYEVTPEDIKFGLERSVLRVGVEFDFSGSTDRSEKELTIDYTGGKAISSRIIRELMIDMKDKDKSNLNFIYYRHDRFSDQEHATLRGGSEKLFDPTYIRQNFVGGGFRQGFELQSWWDKRDAQEARIVRDASSDYRDPELEAIRQLIDSVDGFSGITYSSTGTKPGLYLIGENGARVHISRLSSGEISYLVLLADLARRLQVLSPKTPLNKIPAVVLIDELELSLHPEWQSEIVPKLAKTFSACQFIMSTHSPQVVSGVENRQVRVLTVGKNGERLADTPLSTRGRTSNYLLEGVFGAADRYPPVQRVIDEFNAAIDEGDVEGAGQVLKDLEREVFEDTATMLVLRNRLKKLQNKR